MRLVLGWFLFLCVCLNLTTQSSLELVQVFFRHGSRTPELKDTYPTDIYTEKDFLPMGWGQLTNTGKRRAFKLGQLLRKRYDTFLGDIYTPEIVHTLSTDFDRTKMSALLVLAGLFPPNTAQTWKEDLPWLPIPVNYAKTEQDYFLRRPIHYCPAYVNELKTVMDNNPEIKKILTDNEAILKYISKNTQKPTTTLFHVFQMYQTLNAEESLNMTLPNWTEKVYPKKIHELTGYQCFYENFNDVLKKLNGGRSLSKVLENINNKIENKIESTKIYLYSGHENNVVNVLSALKVFEPHVPKYSAAAIIELHNFKTKEKDDYKVRVLYARDVDDKEPEVKIIDDCEAYCPYQQFVDITRSIIPRNFTEECQSTVSLD